MDNINDISISKRKSQHRSNIRVSVSKTADISKHASNIGNDNDDLMGSLLAMVNEPDIKVTKVSIYKPLQHLYYPN